ncbi:MAG: hypothetical protein CL583_17735 [Alteromonadaceae bacterium]|nr:hypothetical protein [Alteromonadaceae bacterium]
MTLDQFLSGDLHTISFDEAQSLNLSLSKASLEDIPEQQRGMILDYLIVALNMQSVDPQIAPSLDDLRMAIESSGAF